MLPIVRETGLALILEPGRFLVGQAGLLITRVVDIKPQAGGKLFVIVDAGMTELMRPMLYGAYHRIEPVVAGTGPDALIDFVGPICETTDTLGKDRRLPAPAVGDLMVVFDAGAYGSVMASNYNRRLDAGGGPDSERRRHADPPSSNHRRSRGAGAVTLMRGTLIAFEGLDQSGKQTQTDALAASLTAAGAACERLSFPDYATRDRHGDCTGRCTGSATTRPT